MPERGRREYQKEVEGMSKQAYIECPNKVEQNVRKLLNRIPERRWGNARTKLERIPERGRTECQNEVEQNAGTRLKILLGGISHTSSYIYYPTVAS